MAQRQLNIRSDEAAERAGSLARHLGKSTTEVVVEALRAYEASVAPRDERGLTPEARRRYEAILDAAGELRKHIPPGTTLDDDWMYDENGLPR